MVFGNVDGCGKGEFHIEPFEDERGVGIMEEGVGYELFEFGYFFQGEFGVVVDGCQVFFFNSPSFIG